MPPGTRRHPGSLGRVDPRAFLDELTADTDIASSLVHVQHLPARAPAIEPFPDGLPDLLVSRLGLTGVRGLYPHQADGLAVLRDGRDLVIATGTASGKTLVYNAAFAEAALTRPKATALYLYPHEGARPRSAPGRPCVEAPPGEGLGLRRRHPPGRASVDPQEREPRDDEPGHAPPVAAARPRAVGRLLLPALHGGGGRSARVPRRVRLARRDGAAAAPAADRPLRRHPQVVPGLGHRGQPGRTRDPAHGHDLRRGHRRSVAARREALRVLEPARHRRGHRRNGAAR